MPNSVRTAKFYLLLAGLTFASAVHAVNLNVGVMMHALYDYTGLYGSGADGSLTVGGVVNGPANPYLINTVATKLTANAAASATSLTVSATTGFAANDEILIIQMENADAGLMEFATINTVSGGTTLTLNSGLTNAYTSANTVQVLRVNRYTNVTINSGGFISAAPYSNATGTGGILAMKVSGTLTINNGGGGLSGTITMGGGYGTFGGKGYAGGNGGSNGSGPGGGAGGSSPAGGKNKSPGMQDRLQMGSGGGSKIGIAGNGGGVILVKAASLVLDGNIYSNGAAGNSIDYGGGAGGTIAITTDSLTTSSSCGTVSVNPAAGGGSGTAGGSGRIFINYKTTLNCNPGIPASTTNYQKIQLK